MKHSIQVKMSVPIILIAIIVFVAMNFLVAENSLNTAERQAVDKSTAIAKAYANEMRLSVEQGLGIARTLAQHLASAKKNNHLERGPVEHSFQHILESNQGLIGVWTGWEPNAWDGQDVHFANAKGYDKTGRFVPYLSFEKGKATLTPLMDYDKPGVGDYYLVPKARGKETMVEPYLYPVDGVQTLMTSAVVPIFFEGKFVGVAGVDLPLKDLQNDALKIKPFETSTAYLVTNAGNFVAHPDEKMLTKHSTFEVAPEKFKAAFAKGESLVITGMDPDLKEECLYVVSPMVMGGTDAPWSLVIRTPLKTVMADARAMVWTQAVIALIGTLVLLVAVLFIARYIAKAVTSITNRLSETGDNVTVAIEQLSLAGQSLSQSASESAASLEETVAALEEMSSMVRMNSDNAKQAAQLSSQSSESAHKGEIEMTSLMQSMEDISKSSKEIEEIINVIDDIAFQTNLLALNAAVEAARAGEQGKGFAVVAEAVRALAQRSAVAAKDINTLIKSNVIKIENGTLQANRSGEVLKSIVTSVKKVSDLNLEISTASEEQATGIQQISKAMNQLDASVQSNAASSEEIAGTSTDISNQANVMKASTDEMNVFVHGELKKAA
ncbi:methyl-accepting chemotaxis protein [Bdellovibrio sp. SKB1291214]|uniref:methyl-accepting chemotaxis protein n=1 Tax=Bdellovibrio sp. SKB1291214 TaxID=1732569 RepID=UPI0026A209CF|nr:methyl-accepting chemotaxis protein [Bdellovibrio sp. SKB1291214]